MMMNRQPSLVIAGVVGLHPHSGLLTAIGH
jgi:hypothetical protein